MSARLVVFLLMSFAVPALASAAEAMLFRLYLTDGTAVVSYGEFARVGDRVVFSMVLGGTDQPHLHATSLQASAIDWTRTERHAASTRRQWYARTRGEEDFARLSDDVATALNAVVLSPDRERALDTAMGVRRTLAGWAGAHHGYREREVREILAILDEAISGLRAATGRTSFEVALVADIIPDAAHEPLVEMPSAREQIDQAFRVAEVTDRAAERVALLQLALQLVGESEPMLPPSEVSALRRVGESRIRFERRVDARYGVMARQLMHDATRGAERARVTDVERVLDRIAREDARLGGRRPDVVQALRTAVQVQLDAARHLRLLRDQWLIRRSLYADYQRSVGAQLLQLARVQPALEAIRRLEGPPPELLLGLVAQLRGGGERLERVLPPADLRSAHELLLGAWRFAETAVNGRYRAASSADVGEAWEASSSAAGALLLLSRAQQEIRTLIEPPRLP